MIYIYLQIQLDSCRRKLMITIEISFQAAVKACIIIINLFPMIVDRLPVESESRYSDPKQLRSRFEESMENSQNQIQMPAKKTHQNKSLIKKFVALAIVLVLLGVSLELYLKYSTVSTGKPTSALDNIQYSAGKDQKAKQSAKESSPAKKEEKNGKKAGEKNNNLLTDSGDGGKEPPSGTEIWDKVNKANKESAVGIPYVKEMDRDAVVSSEEISSSSDDQSEEELGELDFVKGQKTDNKTPIGSKRH